MFNLCFRFPSTQTISFRRAIASLMVIAFVLLAPLTVAASAEIKLDLSSSDGDRIAGYRIYYKTDTSGKPYNGTGLSRGSSPFDIPVSILTDPAKTQVPIRGLIPGKTYYFIATVFDAKGNESASCKEVSYTVPSVTPLIMIHTINASATGDGTITPEGVTEVEEGDTLTYSIAAAQGYHIADVLVDGESVGGQSTYTFKAIEADHEIEAIFEADPVTPADDGSSPGGIDDGGTPDDSGDGSVPGDSSGDNHMDVIVIDDGTAGTDAYGDWKLSGAVDPYGAQSLYSKEVGAHYTFSTDADGRYEVALWWSGYTSRCAGVPVQIFDGDTLIDTVEINQSQNSGQWNVLGSYDFSGKASLKVTADSKDCSTAADAAKFALDDQLRIIDNGKSGTSANGQWNRSGGTEPYGADSLYSKEIGADYVFQTKLNGNYEISMWWSGYASRCKDVPVEIYDGIELIDTVNVNQSINSGQWNSLGSYHFDGNPKVYVVSDSDTCSTSADAVMFTADNEPKVIDNGDSGTSSNGNWNISNGSKPFGDNSLYSKQIGADYTYTKQINGYYEVALWWSGYKSRCTAVPVEIYDGDNLLDTRYVDQSQNNGQWNTLGLYDFNGEANITIVSDSDACSTSADAVSFVVGDKPKIIDDGDAETTTNGQWDVSGGSEPYGSQSLYSKQTGAWYQYETQLNGSHEIAIWWSGYKSRCTQVPVEIYDGNEKLDRVYVDQNSTSGEWYPIGNYEFNGNASIVIISDKSTCSTSADAVKITKSNHPRP